MAGAFSFMGARAHLHLLRSRSISVLGHTRYQHATGQVILIVTGLGRS